MKVLLVFLAFVTIGLITAIRHLHSKMRYLKNKVYESEQLLELLILRDGKEKSEEDQAKDNSFNGKST